jgi:hypothetical protein
MVEFTAGAKAFFRTRQRAPAACLAFQFDNLRIGRVHRLLPMKETNKFCAKKGLRRFSRVGITRSAASSRVRLAPDFPS